MIAFSCGQASDTPTPQPVSGSVITADGSTLPSVAVQAIPIAESAVGVQHWLAADKDGHFSLLLKPGRYQIRAKAEDAGYPDPNFLLSADPTAHFPIVVVTSQALTEVRVVLGVRGAFVDGEVHDVRSGKPLKDAKVTIADASDSRAYVEVFTNASGEFHFAMPAKHIMISATADGYISSEKRPQRISPSPGEHVKVAIDLEPSVAK
ncbi:MAG: MSCRAMM family protein [Terriglobales bacterium]